MAKQQLHVKENLGLIQNYSQYSRRHSCDQRGGTEVSQKAGGKMTGTVHRDLTLT